MNAEDDTELPLHSFDTKGMNTVFTIRIHHPDKETARRYAGNCFRLLEELEAELSRFRPDSEIGQINLLEAGQSKLLADATYRCLRRALVATEATAGLFDVTLGAQTWRGKDLPAPESPKGILKLSPDRPLIFCEEAGRQIDLGGIGKGFALEELAKELRDLGIESALLSCGASTHLAVGPRSWPFHLRGEVGAIKIQLAGGALSSSGTGEQGAHVVHPDTGAAPGYAFRRVWAIAQSAALADAFSTACLLMDEEEIVSFAEAIKPKRTSIYAESADDGAVRRIE